MILEARLEALQNLVGLRHGRLDHVDLLEPSRQRAILIEDAPILLIGRGAHALDLAGCQQRLEQVGCIHHPARCRARADDRVNLIDEEDRAFIFLELRQEHLEALLKVTPVLGARQQRAEIEGVDCALSHHIGYLRIDYSLRQALRNGGFADAGLTDEERVVLTAAAQHLNHTLELSFTPDQRVDQATLRLLIQVGGEGLQGIFLSPFACHRFFVLLLAAALRAGVLTEQLGLAVRDVVHDVQPGDVLRFQEEHRLALLLAEYRDQDVCAGDLFATRGLHAEYRTLEHPLEAQGRRGLTVAVARGDQRRCALDEAFELTPELIDIARHVLKHIDCDRVVAKPQQQVFYGQKLMPLGSSLSKRVINGGF